MQTEIRVITRSLNVIVSLKHSPSQTQTAYHHLTGDRIEVLVCSLAPPEDNCIFQYVTVGADINVPIL